MSNRTNLLMVFVRNARIGKVKRRLAKKIGDEEALEIYVRLLQYTAEVCGSANAEKAVFYSEYIDESDEFSVSEFQKFLQLGEDLGERMKNSFVKGFGRGYEKIIIVGSDCMELTTEIIDEAFVSLDKNDVVIGPAKDGGYYLLGMRKLYPEFFRNKVWSTSNVFLYTLLDIQKMSLKFHALPMLNDVDEESDLTDELRNLL